MVINNPYYIKEIKKPVETVYELKEENNIPTFEEFMKDYKVDEKVNYELIIEIKNLNYYKKSLGKRKKRD